VLHFVENGESLFSGGRDAHGGGPIPWLHDRESMVRRLILLLRKLGVLRFGITSYRFTSGRDMPAQALMDDVLDEDKDLVLNLDLNRKKRPGNDEEA